MFISDIINWFTLTGAYFLLYEMNWGYLQKGNLHVVVSSGFGTEGPPIRIGNKPEIVLINISFSPK